MARFVVGAVFGLVVGVVAGAAGGLHAADPDDSQEVAHAAELAGVDAQDLQGAVNSTGLDPFVYLHQVGELENPPPLPKPPPVVNAAVEKRLDCIAFYESRGYAGAVNRSSGASGLFQFLASTWRTTPQGRAGLSVFDPVAARNAARWMLEQGRAREWVPVLRGLC